MLRTAEQQARADLATAHEGVTQLQACIAQQQASEHRALSHHPSPSSTAALPLASEHPLPSTPSQVQLQHPQQQQPQQQQQAVHAPQDKADALSNRAAAAEAECQMLRRQLHRAQLQLQLQVQHTATLPAPHVPPSLHHIHHSSARSSHSGQQHLVPGGVENAESSCAVSSSGQPLQQAVPALMTLASMGAAAAAPSAAGPGVDPHLTLQLHSSQLQAMSEGQAAALSAKEARIYELRGALAQCQAERSTLMVQLQVSAWIG